ncbi:MAG: hypothetical protein Q9223_000161 [Gallowayella weberi]
MQYVRSLGGSVSKTWNSINPATLSGAIDVIVVEQEDGSLACSPFHVRFGKFSLLRPFEKKVEFKVNGVKQNYAMKLGEGGEAFFVFETSDQIPESLQTSPVVSPAVSPQGVAQDAANIPSLQEPDFLDINIDGTSDQAPRHGRQSVLRPGLSITQRSQSDYIGSDGRASQANQTANNRGSITPASSSSEAHEGSLPNLGPYAISELPAEKLTRSSSEELLNVPTRFRNVGLHAASNTRLFESLMPPEDSVTDRAKRSGSPPPISNIEAVDRAKSLSTKLSMSNIRSHVTETGDLMLDMTGYKTREDEALRAEGIARRILAEELEGNYDIGALIGADEQGNLWIYSSEEAKEAARQQIRTRDLIPQPIISDIASDPGHQSDEDSSTATAASPVPSQHRKTRSEVPPAGLITPPQTPPTEISKNNDPNRNYAKTLRLTSDQLKALALKPGSNVMSFSVNRATCSAFMYYWTYDVPIVISDIDGTITK